jgi:glycosyltransferase involved in cell wall biosynthesis
MKILFVEPRYHTNQIGWINCLKQNNHEVIMHVVNKGKIEDYSDLKPEYIKPCLLSNLIMTYIGEGGTNKFRSFPNPLKYYVKIKNENPDLIIIRDINRYISIVAIFISRLLNKKIFIYSQTTINKKYSFLRLKFTNFLMKLLNSAWISPVRGNEDLCTKKPQHMYYLPFVVDIEMSNKELDIKMIKLLSIGKFEKRKNHILLLNALCSINSKFELTIIGEVSNISHRKNLIEVINFIKKNNLPVKIKCNIPHSEIKKYYHESDLFILPATREHASISVIESLGYGVPSICSNTNGTKGYIKNNENGLIFEDNSIESLTNCLKTILINDRLSKLRRNLKEESVIEYSCQNFYQKFIYIINKRYL